MKSSYNSRWPNSKRCGSASILQKAKKRKILPILTTHWSLQRLWMPSRKPLLLCSARVQWLRTVSFSVDRRKRLITKLLPSSFARHSKRYSWWLGLSMNASSPKGQQWKLRESSRRHWAGLSTCSRVAINETCKTSVADRHLWRKIRAMWRLLLNSLLTSSKQYVIALREWWGREKWRELSNQH